MFFVFRFLFLALVRKAVGISSLAGGDDPFLYYGY